MPLNVLSLSGCRDSDLKPIRNRKLTQHRDCLRAFKTTGERPDCFRKHAPLPPPHTSSLSLFCPVWPFSLGRPQWLLFYDIKENVSFISSRIVEHVFGTRCSEWVSSNFEVFLHNGMFFLSAVESLGRFAWRSTVPLYFYRPNADAD